MIAIVAAAAVGGMSTFVLFREHGPWVAMAVASLGASLAAFVAGAVKAWIAMALQRKR